MHHGMQIADPESFESDPDASDCIYWLLENDDELQEKIGEFQEQVEAANDQDSKNTATKQGRFLLCKSAVSKLHGYVGAGNFHLIGNHMLGLVTLLVLPQADASGIVNASTASWRTTSQRESDIKPQGPRLLPEFRWPQFQRGGCQLC